VDKSPPRVRRHSTRRRRAAARKPNELMRAAARGDPSWPRADRGQPITVVSVVKERAQLFAASTLAEVVWRFSNCFWPPRKSEM
jgi:hypothetical protein